MQENSRSIIMTFFPFPLRSSPGQPARWWWRPVAFLVLAFATELAIMEGLPVLFPQLPWWQVAALDAGLLTLLLAGPAWLLFMVPLIRLSTARGRLLHRVLSIQEEEQERIARDLHDGLGQSLTAMLMRLRLLQAEPVSADVAQQLGELREVVSGTVEELRRIVREGRPPVLGDLGLRPALQHQLAAFGTDGRFAIDLQWNLPATRRPPASVETTIYRIVGEAVTNAVKHAEATQVTVAVDCCAGGVRARIIDDGRGGAGKAKAATGRQSFGILGMRERATAVGGRLNIESPPGRGTMVEVLIPCECTESPGPCSPSVEEIGDE